jgi:hypothetical protein
MMKAILSFVSLRARHVLVAFALSGAVLDPPCLAVADTDPAAAESRESTAKQRYFRGLERFDHGRFEEALVDLQAAYTLAPNPRILHNIAIVELRLEKNAAAHATFSRYLAEAGASLSEAERQQIRSELERLRALLGAVKFEFEGHAVSVSIDDRAPLPVPLSGPVCLEPGPHRVEVGFKSGMTARRVVTASAGQTQTVLFHEPVAPRRPEVEPAFLAKPEAQAEPESEKASRRWVPWAATGALAAGASVTGLLALERRNQEEKVQDTPQVTRAELEAARSDVRQMAIATDVLLGLTAVSAALSLYLTIEWNKSESEAAAHATVRPSLGGVSVEGSF